MALASVPSEPAAWWDAQVEASLDRAPAPQGGMGAAARNMPARTPRRAGLPDQVPAPPRPRDAAPEALADNVALAYQARAEVPWGPGLPEDVFLDAVLPHASVTEPRDSMRAEFHDRYLPLVRGCKTPGEAALAMNKTLFRDYKVGYNTRRLRTDQSSKESIAQGMATCTGLSIMLVEACRSVGVPARLAGIASWPGRGGNHTWVEVWDDGWHFVGAAEPDEKGLDHAWFVGDAAKAIKGSVEECDLCGHLPAHRRLLPAGLGPVGENARRGRDRPIRSRTARNAGTLPADGRGPPRGQRVEAEVTTLDRETGASRRLGSSLGPRPTSIAT